MKDLRRRDWLPVALALVLGGTAVGGGVLALGNRPAPPPETADATAATVPPKPAPEAPAAPAAPDLPEHERRFARHFQAGVLLLQAGRAEEAVTMFEEARRLRPHVPAVLVNLGFAHIDLDRPQEARDLFQRALELRSTQVNAYFGLAESLEMLGDLPGALGAMRTYVHLSPEDDPHRTRAMSAVWEWQAQMAAAATGEPGQ